MNKERNERKERKERKMHHKQIIFNSIIIINDDDDINIAISNRNIMHMQYNRIDELMN